MPTFAPLPSVFRARRRSFRAVIALAVAGWGTDALRSQTTWQTPGDGLYDTGANWSSGVPSSSTDAAITNGTSGTPTTVELTSAGSVRNLTLAALNTLQLDLGSTLAVYGPSITNAGMISLLAGSANNTTLDLHASVTLTGAGVLSLNYGDHNGDAIIEAVGGSYSLVNAGSTIQGDGTIGNGVLGLVNSAGGTIDANVANQTLTLNGTGGVTNQGMLLATANGILALSTAVNNTGGTILANGGTVTVGGTVTGGALITSQGGVIEAGAGAGLNGVTLTPTSTYTAPLGSTTTLAGSIANQGTIALFAGAANNSYLDVTANVTLTGGGTVTLSSGDDNGQAYLQATATGLTLTNQDNVIQGYGDIGAGQLTFINYGTVDANSSGQTLTLGAAGGVTNFGFLEASAGGVLQLSAPISNGSGTITADNGTVEVSTAVQGGTLTSVNGGTLESVGTATLDGLTQGSITVAAGSTYVGPPNSTTDVLGTLILNGNLQFNAGGATNSALTLVADTSLAGPGTVTLNSGDNNGHVTIGSGSSAYTLTNGVTLQGYGEIGGGALTLANQAAGVIDATGTGDTLTLDGTGGVANLGLLEATANGTLHLTVPVNNLSGTIAANGGTVAVSTTVQGGTLTSVNGGVLETSGAATLDASTQGPLTLSAGSTYVGPLNTTTNIWGAVYLAGNLQLNAGFSNNTFLNLIQGTILEDAGSVTLNSGDNNGQAIIESTGGYQLENLITIQGFGVIGNGGLAVQNGGVINANVAGQTLTLNPGGGLTNSGLLEASNGGILALSGSVLNNHGGTLQVDGGGSVIDFVNHAVIEGGTLTTTNGGTLGVPGTTITLDGSTQGTITLSAGSVYSGALNTTTNLLGTIVNQGTFQLTAGSANNTNLYIADNVTLQGGGTITMNSGDNNGQVYIQSTSPSLTLTNVDNVIQGYGVIGNSSLTLVNAAGGIVNANSDANVLLLNGSGNVQNSGLLEATAGGQLTITNTVTNTSANITANGATVLINGTIGGGTLNSLNGGALGDGGGSATLDGSSQVLTLSSGSTWTGGHSSTTTLLGTIVNQGTFSLSAGSATNAFLEMSGNVTLQGGGTVTLESGDDNGRVFIESTAASTLTDVDNLIHGYGVIGNGNLALTVGSSGTVDADVTGQTLLLNGAGGVANAGTLEASAGTLEIENVVTNTGSVVATGGTVDLVGGTIAGGTLNGTSVETTTSATLDGLSNGTLTLTAGTAYTGLQNTTTTLLGTLANHGTIAIVAGSATNTDLNLGANVTLLGGGSVTLNSGDNNGQAYLQGNGFTLTNADNLISGYGIIGNGTLALVNEAAGLIEAAGAGQTLILNTGGPVTNAGTFEANDAVLSVTNDPTNLSDNTLTGGTWMAVSGGTLSFEGTTNAIVTNNATLILNGSDAQIRTKTGGDGNYQTVEQTLVTNAGTLEVLADRDFTATNPITNSGVIQLGGGTLSAPGLTTTSGSSLTGYGTFAPTGGTLIANGANVSPGVAAAGQQISTLSFGTGLTLGPSGVMVFSLQNAGGLAGTDYDSLNVAGNLSLTATGGSPFSIQVVTINPGTGNPGLATFNASQAYSWTLATASSITGFDPAAFAFNTAGFQNGLGGGSFQVAEAGNTLTLNFSPVPEPATWIMILIGTGLLGWFAIRRSKTKSVAPGGRCI